MHHLEANYASSRIIYPFILLLTLDSGNLYSHVYALTPVDNWFSLSPTRQKQNNIEEFFLLSSYSYAIIVSPALNMCQAGFPVAKPPSHFLSTRLFNTILRHPGTLSMLLLSNNKKMFIITKRCYTKQRHVYPLLKSINKRKVNFKSLPHC